MKGTERPFFHQVTPAAETEQTMPGVDFDRLRTQITMKQVLDLLGFKPLPANRRPMVRRLSPARIPGPVVDRFSVNVAIGRYRCHRCHRQGNQLELWAAATKLPLYQAAIDLCRGLVATCLGGRWKCPSTTRWQATRLHDQQRRGHRYSRRSSQRGHTIDYRDHTSINYRDRSQKPWSSGLLPRTWATGESCTSSLAWRHKATTDLTCCTTRSPPDLIIGP